MRPPFDRLWAGLDPFVEAVALARNAPSDSIRRDIDGRRTFRHVTTDGIACYIKVQRGIGWSRIVGDLIMGRKPVLGAENEWRAIEACRAADVPTMSALAYGETGATWANRLSFIVTEAIEPATDLDTYTKDWRNCPPTPTLKRRLIGEVARIARNMHENGLNHRDFYLCHFLLAADDASAKSGARLALIDLHRMQIRKVTPMRWRDKDLASLLFSSLKIGLTQRDFLRFLKVYLGQPVRDFMPLQRPRLERLIREARRLELRYERKFANRPDVTR